MVKPDVKVNYYAALELPSDASVDDVKKQYRKLALKYHPDRNPGKETEYIPKFQAISAAHEILSDPTTKVAYDGDRRRANLSGAASVPRPTASGQRGNPYAATSSFAPPPRRTADPTGWTRKPTSGAASMADRFANFPGGAPTSKQAGSNKSAASEAWTQMGQKPKPTKPTETASTGSPRQARAPPVPPRGAPHPREEEIRAGMNYRPVPPFNSAAYAHFNGTGSTSERPDFSRSQTSANAPRNGFDPNAPGADEASPAGPSSYANSTFKRPPFGDGARTTSAYPNVGGEKTYISPEELRRSHSDHNATNLPHETTARSGSASPSKSEKTKPQPTTFTMRDDSDSSSSTDDLPQTGNFGTRPRPKKVPVSRMSKTSLNDNQSRPPSQSAADPSGSNKPHNMYGASFSEFSHPATWHDFYPFTMRQPGPEERPGPVPQWAVPPSVSMASAKWASAPPFVPAQWGDDSASHLGAEAPFFSPYPDTDEDEEWTYRSESPLVDVSAPEPSDFPVDPISSHDHDMQQLASAFSGFTIPTSANASDAPERPSSSGFDTNFGTTGEAPVFTGSQAGKDIPVTPGSRRGSPAKQRRNFKSTPSFTGDFPMPKGPSEEWQNFQFGATNPSNGVPLTGTSNPQPVTIEDTSDGNEEPQFAPRPSAFTGDAMDIDDTPPAQSKPARPVAVPLSQWRQSQEMPPPPRRHSSKRSSGDASNPGSRRQSASSVLPSMTPLAESLNAASNGLDDLSSLNNSIPFQSKPSTTHPSKLFTHLPQTSVLPTVPTPPDVPQKLSKSSWKDYTARMAAYLSGPWHQLQRQLAEHNNQTLATEQQMIFKGSPGLEARGAGSAADVGVDAYLARCRQQERWAELHALALGKHNEAIETFIRAKERVRALAEQGILAE